jgi:uncharacterized NAD-dependent epimerase/dehydratase family protein
MDGNAIVYCEGAFRSTNGKTAHGLVRRTRRYTVLSVVDSTSAGQDAGKLLDGHSNGIPILATIDEAVDAARHSSAVATHLVIGLAPDGGRLPPQARGDVLRGIALGLNVDSGLHDFLCEDPQLASLAVEKGVSIRDIRKPPPRDQLHFFSGKIEQVRSRKIAVLGTDSAIGKRTTAWLLVDALCAAGRTAELVGTGQTAWMQGARFGVVMDSLVNDFVAGEMEHAVWSAWDNQHPEAIIIEGQGSLMNPAYPGGYEILAAGRPDGVVLQHAPARKEYDGFPGYRLHSLETQIEAIELVSGRPVVAVTINHERLSGDEIPTVCRDIERSIRLPVRDVLRDGASDLVDVILGPSR